ncbi:MAG: polyprenyl synthetase family protein [Deltaproteobacteria bacterium]|nr:polyprenyl synthetase family protein [Deltaproteobacteria bacterium]
MRIQEAYDLIKGDFAIAEEGLAKNLTSGMHLADKVATYVLKNGGKRIRPLILLLSSRMAGYDGSKHTDMAVVVEYIHTATLLHDDVVDSAEKRRGKPSANVVWDNSTSVLVGDYLLSRAFSVAVTAESLEILKVLAETTALMAEGEVLQLVKMADPGITEDDYLRIITSKTAALFSASCRIPAILAAADRERKNALASYGMNLGVAYQLVDDSLDYVSTDENMGKPTGNDLKEGKLTLPLIKAYRDASEREKAVIRNVLETNGVPVKRDVETVFEIIKEYRGTERTLELAEARIKAAKAALDIFAPTPEKAALEAVADFVLQRNH